MGYNFVVSQVTASDSQGGQVEIAVTIQQVGIAPFYYPLSLGLTCAGISMMTLPGVDNVVGKGESAVFEFAGIPATESCLGAVTLSLESSNVFAGNPIKFAQGDGSIVAVIPLLVPETTAPVTPAPVTPAPVTTETPSPTPGLGICFSGSSVVQVRNKGAVYMSKLEIGDWVNTGGDKFEPIYSFGHRNHDQKAVFLQIHAGNSNILEISLDHMVFESKIDKFVPASTLEKGDILLDSTGEPMIVESVNQITAIGVYAPFTPSGKIVVNDIVASSFVAMLESKDSSLLGFSFQWMAHTFEFPHRVACHYLASWCPTETYTEEGVSTWVALPFQTSRLVLEQDESLFKTMMLTVIITLLLVFYTLEQVFFVPYAMFTTLFVSGLTVAVWKTTTCRSKKPV